MSENKVSLENKGINNSKPTEKDRFAPADNEVSLEKSLKSSSADGLYNTDSRFHNNFYEDREYTEEDFSDDLDPTSQQQLPNIPALSGKVQRWVSSVDESSDSGQRGNFSRAHGIGWRPRHIDTIPEKYKFQYASSGKASNSDMGVFQVAELILMEMPVVLRDMKRRLAEDASKRRARGIGNYVSDQTPYGENYSQMTMDKQEVEVTKGNRVPPVAD